MRKFPIILTLLIFMAAFFSAGSASAADISVFELKGGRVFKGGAAIDCHVNEVPAEIEGLVRYWGAFGPDTSDSVTEAETGVWFFASDGVCVAFVPLESERECQDVIFSPDGGNFVLVTGSDIRPDIFFEVFRNYAEPTKNAENTVKMAEFSGIRGQLTWVDPVRFVMTRIDDTREFEEGGYGWRVSVVMYDLAIAAGKTTVLKEATDTQNFWLEGVVEGGGVLGVLAVREESVKSEKDWGDEEKTENREIRVEIPAAG